MCIKEDCSETTSAHLAFAKGFWIEKQYSSRDRFPLKPTRTSQNRVLSKWKTIAGDIEGKQRNVCSDVEGDSA